MIHLLFLLLIQIQKMIYHFNLGDKMRYINYDDKYKFEYAFDTETGAYFRSGILNDDGNDTGINPFMASFPHLIDVGIMGTCIHGKSGLCKKAGVECYQSGLFKSEKNMSVKDFEKIAKECSGKTNQFALGGRGDPDQHEYFEEILKICKKYNIVPNFTTSGLGMNENIAKLCKKYCGAVAVSWYRSCYTINAINTLLKEGVLTNIHYVLSNTTIDEAIERLRKNDFPMGINSVTFLLHKPVGQGTKENVLTVDNPKVKEFFNEIDKGNHHFKVGIDSCNTPGLLNYCKNVVVEAIDTCEGARFSCYITPDMILLPCSFDQEKQYGVSLKNKTILEAWNNNKFEKFRSIMRNSCSKCPKKQECLGGCPLHKEIVLCNLEYRNDGE